MQLIEPGVQLGVGLKRLPQAAGQLFTVRLDDVRLSREGRQQQRSLGIDQDASRAGAGQGGVQIGGGPGGEGTGQHQHVGGRRPLKGQRDQPGQFLGFQRRGVLDNLGRPPGGTIEQCSAGAGCSPGREELGLSPGVGELGPQLLARVAPGCAERPHGHAVGERGGREHASRNPRLGRACERGQGERDVQPLARGTGQPLARAVDLSSQQPVEQGDLLPRWRQPNDAQLATALESWREIGGRHGGHSRICPSRGGHRLRGESRVGVWGWVQGATVGAPSHHQRGVSLVGRCRAPSRRRASSPVESLAYSC